MGSRCSADAVPTDNPWLAAQEDRMKQDVFDRHRRGLPRRAAGTLGILVLALGLSGCGAYLYDAGRDKSASALVERIGDLDVSTTFETERGNLAKLKAFEIEARDAHNTTLWEQRLWYDAIRPATGSPATFRQFIRLAPGSGRNLISRRAEALGLYSADALKEAAKAWNENRPQLVVASPLASARVRRQCEEGKLTGRFCAENGPTLDPYCKAQTEAPELPGQPKGAIARTCKEWFDERDELTEVRKRRTKVTMALRAKAPKPATEGEGEAKEPSFDLEAIQNGAKKAAEAIAAADGLRESLGTDAALADEQAGALETLLTAFASGETPSGDDAPEDESLQRAAVIVAGLPGLAKDARALLETLDRPQVRALAAFELDRLRIEAAYLKDRIALLERRVAERRARLMASLREAHFLDTTVVLGRRAMRGEGGLGGTRVASIVAGGGRSNQHVLAMRALVALDHSQTVARRDKDRALFNILDLDHRQALLADEYAARQWVALIRPAVERLAEYHASGVRPEAIADLIVKIAIAAQLGFIN